MFGAHRNATTLFASILLVGSTTGFAPRAMVREPFATSRRCFELRSTTDAGDDDDVSASVAMTTTTTTTLQRRAVVGAVLGTVFASVAASSANALDMDAFMNDELTKDQKNCNPKLDPKCIPKLTQDEALCKYGQSGNARGEACKRVRESGKELPTAKPQGKSLGGAYAM